MAKIRIPLIGTPTNRSGTSDKDQRYVNCYPEEIKTEATDSSRYFCVKRAGHILDSTVTASGEARGIYNWRGDIYTVYGNKVYKNGTSLLTLETTTGTVGFEDFGSNQQQLFICDGLHGYIVYVNGTYVRIVPRTWVASTAYSIGDRINPTTFKGISLVCTVAGTSGGAEPAWNTTIDGTTADGTVTWKTIEYVDFPTQQQTTTRSNTTAYVLGTIILDGSYPDLAFVATTAGTTGGSTPAWSLGLGQETKDGSVVWTTISASSIVTGHIPKPIFIDGYIALLNSNGDLVNSEVEDPLTWPALDFVTPEVLPDKSLWMERQANHIAVFSQKSIEFFYNAGNASGSPFDRTEQATILVGLAAENTVVQRDGLILFVAKSGTGGTHVAAIEGLKIKPLTGDTYNRVLEAEGTNIRNSYAYTVRSNGHYFYVLNLPVQRRCLVYDITQKFWHEWEWQGVEMPFKYSVERNQDYLLQQIGTTDIFKMDTNTFQDDGSEISMLVQTPRLDGGNNLRKYCSRVTVIGDAQTVDCPITLKYTDNDYKTFSNIKTANMSAYRATFTRLGAFRRRAFVLNHTANTAFRAEVLELDVDTGED